MENASPQTIGRAINWHTIQAVLVDMDGTLLDLAFDNGFWLRTLPLHISRVKNVSLEVAQELVVEHANLTRGSMQWYCIDHWSERMGVDIRALKFDQRQLIRWLPGAQQFVQALSALPIQKWIATNAHPFVLSLKHEQVGVQNGFDRVITCHEFNAPKETSEFWRRISVDFGVDLSRIVFIDDSVAVLEAAARAGVGQCIRILNPEGNLSADRPALPIEVSVHSVIGVHELIESITLSL